MLNKRTLSITTKPFWKDRWITENLNSVCSQIPTVGERGDYIVVITAKKDAKTMKIRQSCKEMNYP